MLAVCAQLERQRPKEPLPWMAGQYVLVVARLLHTRVQLLRGRVEPTANTLYVGRLLLVHSFHSTLITNLL